MLLEFPRPLVKAKIAVMLSERSKCRFPWLTWLLQDVAPPTLRHDLPRQEMASGRVQGDEWTFFQSSCSNLGSTSGIGLVSGFGFDFKIQNVRKVPSTNNFTFLDLMFLSGSEPPTIQVLSLVANPGHGLPWPPLRPDPRLKHPLHKHLCSTLQTDLSEPMAKDYSPT